MAAIRAPKPLPMTSDTWDPCRKPTMPPITSMKPYGIVKQNGYIVLNNWFFMVWAQEWMETWQMVYLSRKLAINIS